MTFPTGARGRRAPTSDRNKRIVVMASVAFWAPTAFRGSTPKLPFMEGRPERSADAGWHRRFLTLTSRAARARKPSAVRLWKLNEARLCRSESFPRLDQS